MRDIKIKADWFTDTRAHICANWNCKNHANILECNLKIIDIGEDGNCMQCETKEKEEESNGTD